MGFELAEAFITLKTQPTPLKAGLDAAAASTSRPASTR